VERQRLLREQASKGGYMRAAAIRRGYSNPLTRGYY
jgi:hypothetical protein